MNYPKWVDMEFIMYLKNMANNSDSSSGESSWSLSFQGKVSWRPRLFGRMGFGITKVSFNESASMIRPELGVLNFSGVNYMDFYASLGLGWRF